MYLIFMERDVSQSYIDIFLSYHLANYSLPQASQLGK